MTAPEQIQALNAEAATSDWVASSVCSQVDPEMWFAETGGNAATRQALALCHTCPVMAQCRAWAFLRREYYGAWGGLGAPARRAALVQGPEKVQAMLVDAIEHTGWAAASDPGEDIEDIGEAA